MTDPVVELLHHDLTHKKLRTYLSDTELQSTLTKLYRSSRLSLEENGANTLHLAIGFLKWYESPKSEQARYAPLLLLPVEIIRRSAQKGYVIRSREEETRQNHFEAKAVVAEVVKRLAEAKRSHIQSSRISSEGVADIKAFLQYSEKGISSLPQMQNILTGPQKTFEKMVAQALQDRGYTVKFM